MNYRYFDYGIDAPKVILALVSCGFFIPILYWGLWWHYGKNELWANIGYFSTFIILITLLGTAFLMMLSSIFGKPLAIQDMLHKINWRGDEYVLDVGCGRGLVTVLVAQKLRNNGRVVGIDIWNKDDLSGNSLDATHANIQRFGLQNQIDIKTANVLDLPFLDETFDIVTANLVVHNITDMNDRFVALDQMLRVLKPGGYLLIQDIFCTYEYFQYFSCCDDVASMHLSGLQFKTFPFSRTLVVKKHDCVNLQ